MDATDPTTGLLANIRERTRSWLRRREASVDPGAKVRDGLEGHLLHVENISDIRAEEYAISGSPLPEYGQNIHLDCESDVVLECSTPLADDIQAYPISRITPLHISSGDLVRDRFTGDVLRVKCIRDTPAEKCLIDGTPLSEYRENQTLACRSDWVVGCEYHYVSGNELYDFPLSRLAPRKYPTDARAMKKKVRNSTECFSCRDGLKERIKQSACQSCRDRIFARDKKSCQQQECNVASSLVIHHLSYLPNSVTGTMPDRYLIVLCNDHHAGRHGID